MSELVTRGRVALPLFTSRATSTPGGERGPWYERALALTENELYDLHPLLNAEDLADALRKMVRACADLQRPGKALAAAFSASRDQFMRQAFALRTLAAFLQAREHGTQPPKSLTLDAWCRQLLEREASQDPDLAARLADWCKAMLELYGPGSVHQDADDRQAQPQHPVNE